MWITFSFLPLFFNVGTWKETGKRCTIFLFNGAVTGKVNIGSG